MITKKKAKKRTKSKSKESNPAWMDKLLGRKPISRDTINISVRDGTISLSGKKFVESGKELNDILETTLKDLKIEFIPLTEKGKRYVLNRVPFDDQEESGSEPYTYYGPRGLSGDIPAARRRR